MAEHVQTQSPALARIGRFFEALGRGLARHWLTVANGAVLIYVGLPFVAPLLLAAGFSSAANAIYRLYSLACHQLPSRAFYVAGEQVAICQRDVAIYVSMLVGGLLFGLLRQQLNPLRPGWYLLLILPMAFDGGTQLVSELNQYVPLAVFWGLGLIAVAGLAVALRRRGRLSWLWLPVFVAGLLGLLYLQFLGPYQSDLLRRTATGALFGFSTVWLVYPHLEEALTDVIRKT